LKGAIPLVSQEDFPAFAQLDLALVRVPKGPSPPAKIVRTTRAATSSIIAIITNSSSVLILIHMFQAAYKPCFLLRLGPLILFAALKIEGAYFFEHAEESASHVVRLARPYHEKAHEDEGCDENDYDRDQDFQAKLHII
jgi:hypothetical protein